MNKIHKIRRFINEPKEPFTSDGMIRVVSFGSLGTPTYELLCSAKNGQKFWLRVPEVDVEDLPEEEDAPIPEPTPEPTPETGGSNFNEGLPPAISNPTPKKSFRDILSNDRD